MRKETDMKIDPIRVGAYEQPNSWVGRVLERYSVKANLHSGIREIRKSNEHESHYYQLPDLIGYHIGTVLIDDGKFIYVDKIDKRRVDVNIQREVGSYWKVTGINEHVMHNGHNGTLKPLSRLELLVR